LSRRLRPFLVAALAALALVGTAGCQQHAGTAAYVGEQRITTTDVDRAAVRAADAQGPTSGESAQNSLNVLIQTALLQTVADKVGTKVSPAFLAEARADAGIRQQAAQLGVSPEAFGSLAGYFVSIQNDLARQLAPGADPGAATQEQVAQVQARLTALRAEAARTHQVTVNPRYGQFDVQRALVTSAAEAGIKELTPPRGAATAPGQAPAGG
jgi:hypothetical protein